jgi:hypothetical protein
LTRFAFNNFFKMKQKKTRKTFFYNSSIYLSLFFNLHETGSHKLHHFSTKLFLHSSRFNFFFCNFRPFQ